MTEHTPTPWTTDDSEHGIYPIWAKCGPLNVQPATAHGSDDAAFIIKAVNNHDALVGALRFILAFYEPGQRHLDTEAWKCAEAGARAALRDAERPSDPVGGARNG